MADYNAFNHPSPDIFDLHGHCGDHYDPSPRRPFLNTAASRAKAEHVGKPYLAKPEYIRTITNVTNTLIKYLEYGGFYVKDSWLEPAKGADGYIFRLAIQGGYFRLCLHLPTPATNILLEHFESGGDKVFSIRAESEEESLKTRCELGSLELLDFINNYVADYFESCNNEDTSTNGDNSMQIQQYVNSVTPNLKTVGVRFKGARSESQPYSYKTTLTDLEIDDRVVVQSGGELKVGKVVEIHELLHDAATKWVVQKLDLSHHHRNLQVEKKITNELTRLKQEQQRKQAQAALAESMGTDLASLDKSIEGWVGEAEEQLKLEAQEKEVVVDLDPEVILDE